MDEEHKDTIFGFLAMILTIGIMIGPVVFRDSIVLLWSHYWWITPVFLGIVLFLYGVALTVYVSHFYVHTQLLAPAFSTLDGSVMDRTYAQNMVSQVINTQTTLKLTY